MLCRIKLKAHGNDILGSGKFHFNFNNLSNFLSKFSIFQLTIFPPIPIAAAPYMVLYDEKDVLISITNRQKKRVNTVGITCRSFIVHVHPL